MFLILHHQDIQTLSFINYCKKKQVDFIELSMNKLINHTKIISYVDNNQSVNEWLYKDKSFIIENFSGIFNQSYYPEEDLFNQFISEDKNYAQTEWHSYILYILSNHHNCMNPVSFEQFVGINLSLPSIYKECVNFGFKAPTYQFLLPNTDLDKIKKLKNNDYIFKLTAYDYINYGQIEPHSNPMIAIKMARGAQLLCYVINHRVFAKIRFADEEKIIELKDNIANQCRFLIQSLDLKIAELLFILTPDNEYICYHVSPYPNWNLLGTDKFLLWDYLIQSLNGHV